MKPCYPYPGECSLPRTISACKGHSFWQILQAHQELSDVEEHLPMLICRMGIPGRPNTNRLGAGAKMLEIAVRHNQSDFPAGIDDLVARLVAGTGKVGWSCILLEAQVSLVRGA